MQSLDGPHWCNAFLKPELRTLLVSVYGYDPVTERNDVLLGGITVELTGVHPDDPELDLLPPEVGVSGVRKENNPFWNNSMAGKVRFTGLPPVHWRVTGNREYVDHPPAGQPVEIRVSEYYTNNIPTNLHVVRTETDSSGEFRATLLPGPYGIVLPGLEQYTGMRGATLERPESNPGSVIRNWLMWPYYEPCLSGCHTCSIGIV